MTSPRRDAFVVTIVYLALTIVTDVAARAPA